MNNYRVKGTDIVDVEIVDGSVVPPQSQPQHLPPKQIYPQMQSQPPPVQQHQYHVPPLPACHNNFAPPGVMNAPPPAFHSFAPPPAPPTFVRSPPQAPVHLPTPAAKAAPPPFEDPAIVSMSRKPTVIPAAPAPEPQLKPSSRPNFGVTTPTRTPVFPVPSAMARSGSHGSRRQSSQDTVAPFITANASGIPAAAKFPLPRALGAAADNNKPESKASTLQQQFTETSLRNDVAESSAFGTDDPATPFPPKSTYPSQRRLIKILPPRRKGPKQMQQNDQFMTAAQQPQEGSVVLLPGMFGSANAAAGAGYGGQKKKSKRWQRYESGDYAQDEEGWATEDVTDFKETEFDFQGNLDRFDKKTVFSQIKAEDTTTDDARLVSFNRLPKRDKVPSRKNYRNNENVLNSYPTGQSLADRDGWKSPEFAVGQSGDSDDDDDDEVIRGRNFGAGDSGRSSRQAMSHQSVSSRLSTRQMSTTGRGSTDNLQALSSSGSGIMSKPSKPSFRLTPGNRPCPTVSPLQMLDVERIAEVELGLTDDMMTENAGRGIAQVAIQAFGKRISASNHNALPVALVFAGNNKSGARAIAAGRHLKNHHVRVMACVLGLEHEDELLENVRRQLNIFRNAGGRVASWPEMQSNLKAVDSPPELIIDGLLGWHLGFEDLRTDHRATAFELVQFANKSKASVLSVDIPSGVDGSSGIFSPPILLHQRTDNKYTGEIAQLEDTDAFYMRAKWVVCMGAPKSGLLHAIVMGVGAGWSVFVADIGISNTAWRKYGTRRRHGVEFSSEWVTQVALASETAE